jgi:hypothetical protein
MDSLTTAYLVCMGIGSVCAVGGALAGNRAFPIESSAVEPISPQITEPTPSLPPQNTAQAVPAASSATQ